VGGQIHPIKSWTKILAETLASLLLLLGIDLQVSKNSKNKLGHSQ
jgi:hypothetical protein